MTCLNPGRLSRMQHHLGLGMLYFGLCLALTCVLLFRLYRFPCPLFDWTTSIDVNFIGSVKKTLRSCQLRRSGAGMQGSPLDPLFTSSQEYAGLESLIQAMSEYKQSIECKISPNSVLEDIQKQRR